MARRNARPPSAYCKWARYWRHSPGKNPRTPRRSGKATIASCALSSLIAIGPRSSSHFIPQSLEIVGHRRKKREPRDRRGEKSVSARAASLTHRRSAEGATRPTSPHCVCFRPELAGVAHRASSLDRYERETPNHTSRRHSSAQRPRLRLRGSSEARFASASRRCWAASQ